MDKTKKTVVVESRKREVSDVTAEAKDVKAEPYRTKVSPCALQTQADIETYYRNAETGSIAVVRQTQHHMLGYSVTEIDGTNPKKGRTYIKQFGAFYMKSGKNCFHPKGQRTLVVPTPEVLAWADKHPRGEFGYQTFTQEQYQALFRPK
ncbi:hypothetical protein ASE04_12245 [Rhizobium sp. Root708]|nr:hypothetical protein ASE04_12245 [Rhizobium sp. Root708]